MATINHVNRTLEISFDALNDVEARIRFLADSLQSQKSLDEFQVHGLAEILRDISHYIGEDLRSEHQFRYRNREAQ